MMISMISIQRHLLQTRSRRRLIVSLVAYFVASGNSVGAQSAPGSKLPQFEVASIRLSQRNVGVTAESRQWGDKTGAVRLLYISLCYVIAKAYAVSLDAISGPSWLDTDRFDIVATVPRQAASYQIDLMFQRLLAERFELKAHRDSKMAPTYALVIGKNGLKLREAVASVAGGLKLGSAERGSDGSISGAGKGDFGEFKLTVINGILHYEFASMTMPALAQFLSQGAVLGRPVEDKTQLTGPHQVQVDIPINQLQQAPSPGTIGSQELGSLASEPAGTSVETSLRKQGLELEGRRSRVEVLIIDSIN